MNLNLKKIEEKLNNKNTIITNENDVFYLTRFKSSNLKLLVINGIWYAATDLRYLDAAIKNIKNMKVIDSGKKGWIKKIIEENKFDEIFLNEKDTDISTFKYYKKVFKENYNIDVKTFDYGYIRDEFLEEDINYLIESSKLNDEIFSKSIKQAKIGMSEKELESIILKEIIDSKADKPSFDPIVASGISGASPHHSPSDKLIKKNEFITIDMGVFYNGFASDMTRTFVLEGKVTDKEQKIWNIVNKTMESCIEKIKPGIKCKDLHQLSIDIITNEGYGEYFTHSLGHGVGIEIHDEPNISIYSNKELKEGMVITIEPGIYIPGKYGVRLEQTVLVTNNGHKILSNTKVNPFL